MKTNEQDAMPPTGILLLTYMREFAISEHFPPWKWDRGIVTCQNPSSRERSAVSLALSKINLMEPKALVYCVLIAAMEDLGP